MCKCCESEKKFIVYRDGVPVEPNFCPFCGRALTGKTICKICGEQNAEIKGMCRTCYNREWKRAKVGHHDRTDIWCDQSKAIAADYQAGMKQIEIAKKHGVSRQWVSQIVKKMEVKNV